MEGMTDWLALTLLGVGAMNSPRYPPAGLLIRYRRRRVMLDGGPGAEPEGPVDAWLVTDEQAELIRPLRRLAADRGTTAVVDHVVIGDLDVEPRPVRHTAHPTVGYLIRAGGATAAWAPEFWTFPDWAQGVDLLFAEAAGWRRPVRFARGVGGHMAAYDVAEEARWRGVRRLVLAHIGRPSLKAIDAGERPSFGEWGLPGRTYRLPARRSGDDAGG
jgi:Beta-lactamase superfamily domain